MTQKRRREGGMRRQTITDSDPRKYNRLTQISVCPEIPNWIKQMLTASFSGWNLHWRHWAKSISTHSIWSLCMSKSNQLATVHSLWSVNVNTSSDTCQRSNKHQAEAEGKSLSLANHYTANYKLTTESAWRVDSTWVLTGNSKQTPQEKINTRLVKFPSHSLAKTCLLLHFFVGAGLKQQEASQTNLNRLSYYITPDRGRCLEILFCLLTPKKLGIHCMFNSSTENQETVTDWLTQRLVETQTWQR